MNDAGQVLADHITAELRDPEPKGFQFDELVLRQDASLQRLADHLAAEPEAEVAEALGLLLERERDGWTRLKVLELADRLAPPALAPALMRLLEAGGGDERSRFLQGRAAEVLLRLPLDLETRARAAELSEEALREAATFRGQALRARSTHRPRRVEWAILVLVMVLGLSGLIFALQAVD